MAVGALDTDSAMSEQTGPETTPVNCCHAYSNYCIGNSELKGEDVVFVEHRRTWPGSDLSTHSTFSTASTIGSVAGGDLDSANVGNRWLPADFPPACTECGALTNTYSLYCVFDGHNGVHAAKMAGDSVLPLVEARLPLGCPPPQDHPSYTQFREGIQLALVEAVVEMNQLFAQRGIHAGCTATIVLQHQWLVTAAGLGDSRAMLDTGFETLNMSADHRVATHKAERRRVEAMGAIVAPLAMWGTGPADDYCSGIGPLRIWPGGLSISRAIGDFDVGDAVLPFPHVMQVMLPPTGGRLLVGSDGIWDAFDKMARAGGMSRAWSTEATPTRMIQTIVRAFGGLKDDTTLIVADILPHGMTFQQMIASTKKGGSPSNSVGGANGNAAANGGGGFCGCFGGAPATMDDSSGTVDASVRSNLSTTSIKGGRGRVELLASIDVAGIMGLMPEAELVVPGWYNADVGERLFKSASDAADSWRAAHDKRYARPPSTPAMPEVTRPKRKGRKVAFSEEPEEMAKPKVEKADTGAIRRSSSLHFPGTTADTTDDYASKFGHYKDADEEELTPTFMTEPSVRAGRVYNSEASVRAGKALQAKQAANDDPSVRLRGSNMDGSLHLKTSALKSQDPAGLVPVRVVQRKGSATAQPASNPVSISEGRDAKGRAPNDSVQEHMLAGNNAQSLTSIGE